MPLFFLEMGQGIIAGGDFRVGTSALHSCTLVAAHNLGTKLAGAFHLPSGGLGKSDVAADLDAWAAEIKPTAVVLVFARNATSFAPAGLGGTPGHERHEIEEWARKRCLVAPGVKESTQACMELVKGEGFHAGSPSDCDGEFSPGQGINLSSLGAGRYSRDGGFVLFGRDRMH
jgi:hypothetical protein